MMHGFGYGNSMFMGGGIFMFIFWILIAVLIVSLLKDSSLGKNRHSKQSETPMEILKKRYAKGEITREQYQNMKEKLKD
ncbi:MULTISPECIES: SHOCT domain-containing protein [Psychrilyobacter]|uniref:SHOCT domain-containing protein n=1 Tax=Psychrilyobacter piezotolerans TaxID=2293438 RepID=A0ABX9KHW7_9FUSO|nr:MULTISPECIES: SHOCT domain-containing protein [Psychrilyobacter]MCS5423147.1 SHOCT domain-containing protein [Psychrilyobacter sp. S5]NDI77532.1 SHOCT domain-containing protein [Psychrilyobacter piezotolerans]RDE62956.1 SHOCT domain-containing protein [Psychrilyobacter sp. S5]REI41714.1 SHOCT domain-containing protein [Psychrilyobacter piezotolerans]